MELQWNQTGCTYLHRDLQATENLEQIQEVRLPDGMPDVGRVLCAWGQPMLRSKEWRNENVAVSGGVNAWVLYTPEDGGQPQCVEVWLPFQAKWNLPGSRREGVIRANCCLRSVDGRTLSARKIMVRASVGLVMEAVEQREQPIFQEGELPEGVQLLRKTYPVMLPKEAGEKLFTMEEEITISSDQASRICSCQVYPQITEPAVIGGRAVFRGNCKVHIVYLTESGNLARQVESFPFAQYAELDHDYDQDAQLSVMPVLSLVEPEITDNGIRVKMGLIAQYLLCPRQLLTLVEDAYSPWQEVKPIMEELTLPVILDCPRQILKAEGQMQLQDCKVVDVTFFPDQPTQFREETGIQSQMQGAFQLLYYDGEGQLQCDTESWSGEWQIPMDANGEANVLLQEVQPTALLGGNDPARWETEMTLEAITRSQTPLKMITGLQLGEKREPEASRPTLVLRRPGKDSLWALAKRCGSTVEAIERANHLSSEPGAEQILLIPIL